MRFSWALCLACAAVLCWCEATPLPFYTASETSGDQGLDMPATKPTTTPNHAYEDPLYTTQRVLTHSPTHSLDSTGVEHFLLGQMRDFLQENLVLVLLITSLMGTGIFLVCCASAISRQRKFASYYPSSFPATCYVDQLDKAGGEPAFRHVPNRPPEALVAEPQDSAHQLQQEILTAARKLRTPTKAPMGGRGSKDAKCSPLELQQSQLDTPQSKEAPTEIGQEVTPTEKEQEVAPTVIDQGVTTTEIEQEVTLTETDQKVTLTKTEQEVTPTETEQEVTVTKTEQEVIPTETKQEVAPTEVEQEVTTTETGLKVTPTVIEQEVVHTEVKPEVTTAETEQEVAPTEIEQEVTTTETEKEVTPTEQELMETVQETDRPLNAESECGSGASKEPGAQQEIRSPPVETQEVAGSPVKLICGEMTAF